MSDEAMLDATGFADRLKLRASTILWFLLGLGFLIGLPVLLGWALWLFLIVVAAAALLALPTAWAVRRLFAGQRRRGFAVGWAKAAVALACGLTILIAAPIYYLVTVTEARPAIVPQATLTNGSKTIVFQGMMHVGTERFYKSVVYDVEQAITDGYVIYHEGVRKSTPEGNAWLAHYLGGGGELADNYKLLARSCGLVFQLDYFSLIDEDMAEHPERHVAADVSSLDMKHEFDRLARGDPHFAARAEQFAAALNSPDGAGASMASFVEWQKRGTASQKALAGIVCRGVMTMVIDWTIRGEQRGPLDPVIIDFRNRALAQRLLTDPRDRIYVAYGAVHLPGVIALLQRADPRWKVVSVKWMRTIEPPDRLGRRL